MNVVIDSALPRDAAAIALLRTRVAERMTREFGDGPWSTRTNKSQVLRQMQATQMLVARQGGEIIGTVRLATPPPVFDASAFTPVANALYVFGLAVSFECRNRGIGGMLMAAARRAARDRGAEALWLDVYEHPAGAGPFYLRCGFQKVGPAPGGDIPLSFYEQSLPGS